MYKRQGVDTRGFDFSRLPREYAEMDTQAFKGELGTKMCIRDRVTALELAPEGTNYRAKTRFAKFYNLPELMQMFREVADIQTACLLYTSRCV